MSDAITSGTAESLQDFIQAVDGSSQHGKNRVVVELKDNVVHWHRESVGERVLRWLNIGPSARQQNAAFITAVNFLKDRAIEQQWSQEAKSNDALGGRIIRAVDTLDPQTRVAKRSTVVNHLLKALEREGVATQGVAAFDFTGASTPQRQPQELPNSDPVVIQQPTSEAPGPADPESIPPEVEQDVLVRPGLIETTEHGVRLRSTVTGTPRPPNHPLTGQNNPTVIASIGENREGDITRQHLLTELPRLQEELNETTPSEFQLAENRGDVYGQIVGRYTPGEPFEVKGGLTDAPLSEIAHQFVSGGNIAWASLESIDGGGFIFHPDKSKKTRDAGNKFHISVPVDQYKEALDAIAPLLASPDNPFSMWKIANPSSSSFKPGSHTHDAEQFTLYANPLPESWTSKEYGNGSLKYRDSGRYSAELIRHQGDFILALEHALTQAGIGELDVPKSDIRVPQWRYASYSNDSANDNRYRDYQQRMQWTADQAEQPYFKLVSQIAPQTGVTTP